MTGVSGAEYGAREVWAVDLSESVHAARRYLKDYPNVHVVRGDLHDVPRPGAQIRAGHPVCTVYASGRGSAACYTELVRRAARIHDAIAML